MRQISLKKFSTARLAITGILFAVLAPLSSNIHADSVKLLHFGPFFMNQLNISASPVGFHDVLSDIRYHFQIGWIEPLAENAKGIFSETYFETDGDFNFSPFTSNIGTTFNLKPIRYLEFGLSYNRLVFHNSMVTFKDVSVTPDMWKPSLILPPENRAGGGADIFTFQGNVTYNMGPIQWYFYASRMLFDIDAKGRNFVYEYGNDILIKPRDRINTFILQSFIDLRPHSIFKSVSYTGIILKDQYWFSDHTELEKNLVSAGISGFRFGVNPERQRRGLDLSLGYWTSNPQISRDDEWTKNIMILADWKWNIQFLKI